MNATTDALSPNAQYALDRLRAGLHLIPGHMAGGIERYVMRGVPCGNFLAALLSNDFMEAAARGDDENQDALVGWAKLLYNYTPSGCYGSPEKFKAWIAQGGLIGGDA